MTYADDVLSDEPLVYWRFGDDAPAMVAASASSTFFASSPTNAFSGDGAGSSWITGGTSTGWIAFQLAAPAEATYYAITRVDDIPARNPVDWTYEGSDDGATWDVLDTQAGVTWPTPGERKEFPISPAGPYAYYRLNVSANDGDTYLQVAEIESDALPAFADASGDGHDGRWFGPAPTTGLLEGDSDGAVDFDGSNDFGALPSASWMDVGQEFSIEAVIQPDDVTAYHAIAARDDSGSVRMWNFRITSAGNLQLLFWTTAGGPYFATGGRTLEAGKKCHVAATYDGANAKVFVNGVVDGSVAATGDIVGSTTLHVGRDGFGFFFDGIIDELAIYHRVLRGGRFGAHARGVFPLIYENFDGLLPSPTWVGYGNLDSVTDSPDPDVPYEITFGSGGGAVLRDAPAGDQWSIEMELEGLTSGSMAGIVMQDASGNGVGAGVYHFPVGLLLCSTSGYFYSGSFVNVDDTDDHYVSRLRLIRRGAGYFTQHSEDGGATWSAENAVPFTVGAVPTRVGFGDWLNGSSLTISEFMETPPEASYDAGVLSDGPALYLRLNEPSGASLIDSSGNDRHLTLSGTPIFAVAGLLTGDSDAAMDFDGDTFAYVAGSWSEFSHFSAEAIIEPSALSGDNIIVARTSFANAPSDTGSRGWHLITKDDRIRFGMTMTDGSFEEVDTDTVLEVGEKYHVLATWDGTTARVFVNGVLDWSSTTLAGKTLNNVSGQAVTVSGENGFGTLANYHGVIDEVALYDYAVPGGRAAAHRDLMTGGTPDPLVIPVGLATETDTAYKVGPLNIPVGLAEEADTARPVTAIVPGPLVIPVGMAVEDDGVLPLAEPEHILTFVRMGKAIETEEALEINPIVQTVAPVGQAVESELALPIMPFLRKTTGIGVVVDDHLEVLLGVAEEREVALPIHRLSGLWTDVLWRGSIHLWRVPSGTAGIQSVLTLDILDRELPQAPTSLLVSVEGALPQRKLRFSVDGEFIYEVQADGPVSLLSVPIDETVMHGEHVLRVDQDGAAYAEDVFELAADPDTLPTAIPIDTEPVEIPESIHPSGVRRWVLQDLTPGGLGSYVMPLNPQEMDNPSFERVLTSKFTTAGPSQGGQAHVSEPPKHPLEWSFKGYCPTQEMAEKLRAYGDLHRRFYIHDHRGRALKVVVTQADLQPRLQQQNIYGELTDWVHDYTMNCVIFDITDLP